MAQASACPGGPLEKAVVDSDPIYQTLCSTVPPCLRPAKPIVLDDPSNDFIRSQGLVVEATVPSGFTADRIRWFAEDAGYTTIWYHDSVEDIKRDMSGNPIPGPYTVRFGAPGLIENSAHRFRVSFRRDSDDFWLCLSERSDPVSTTPFSTFGPTAPVTVQVEEHFRRPETDFKANEGDGLGPDAVWNENTGQNSARIKSDQSPTSPRFSAFLEPTTLAKYVPEAGNPHNYVEGLFRRNVPGPYNIDLATKYHELSQQPMVMNYYMMKLTFNHRGCDTNPTMFLVRAVEEGPSAVCVDSPGDPPNPMLPSDAALAIPDDDQPKCNEPPPFGVEDGADTFSPKRSNPVWMRIEADKDDQSGLPVIKGTVAWNCPDDQVIDQCLNLCTLTRTDHVNNDMRDVTGKWGFWVHDRAYYLDFFRAGSDPF